MSTVFRPSVFTSRKSRERPDKPGWLWLSLWLVSASLAFVSWVVAWPVMSLASTNPLSLVWSSAEVGFTYGTAWGDYDGDGDLDLATGNGFQPNHLYRNDNGTLTLTAIWSSVENDNTQSIAWGDYDNDGDLDLVAGNSTHPNRLYQNVNGFLTTTWSAAITETTYSVAWGDVDGDGRCVTLRPVAFHGTV